ncbi:MAG: heavy metal-associated domain-containing protein [Bacillota bacterium]|nr:heavy metal-associated domain-containing protein [Bacillota bacterium]
MCESCGCGSEHHHTHLVLPVGGMSCAHCSKNIEDAVNKLPGVSARADHQTGSVELTMHDDGDLAAVKQAIADLGFDV